MHVWRLFNTAEYCAMCHASNIFNTLTCTANTHTIFSYYILTVSWLNDEVEEKGKEREEKQIVNLPALTELKKLYERDNWAMY